MPEIFGLIAQLLVDEQPLEEHAVQMDDGTTRSCFVASEEGKAFSIEIGNLSAYEHVVFEMLVDGTQIDSFLLENGDWKVRSSVKISSQTCKPLVFSKIVTSDDDDALDSPTELGSLGTIEFRVWWVQKMMKRDPTDDWEKKLPDTPISERAKVSTSHRISLGPPTAKQKGIRQIVRQMEPDKGPVARLIFRYRPKNVLQAEGIFNITRENPVQEPTSPRNLKRPAPAEKPSDEECSERARKLRRTSSVSLEVKREPAPNRTPHSISELSATEEVVVLREQVRTMQERLDRLERERTVKAEFSQVPKLEHSSQHRFVKKEEPLSQVRRIVKREVSPIRLPFPSGEIFDLTDD
ncbi:hypothetical protein QCA50_007171 [Cerrena zonata]|uniref:DUF7918 domain-containing protein n=1 Tax=Cerrena zonata TaxID=2478898 RepID=A0AAW0GI01_9APHY